jgi:hypothetical protein
MKDEPTLFDFNDDLRKMSRRTDPFTSKEAAQKALPKVGSDKAKVLSIFQSFRSGLIDEQLEELAVEAGVWSGNASKRRSDLSRDGFLVWTGETRMTRANKKSKVWKAKD